MVALRLVPPAPSSTTIRSALARSAPISVAPSMLIAETFTLSAVVISFSLLSAMLPASMVLVTPDAFTFRLPPANSIEDPSTSEVLT